MTVSLRAHYDGEHIQLDEPFDLPPDAPLLVTVLVAEKNEDEYGDRRPTMKEALNRANPILSFPRCQPAPSLGGPGEGTQAVGLG